MSDWNDSQNDLTIEEQLMELLEKAEKELDSKDQTIRQLLSEKHDLASVVQLQKNKIAEQAEQIVKLNESDLILQDNKKLKEEMQQLRKEWNEAESQAEEVVQNCKREYSKKLSDVLERENRAKELLDEAERTKTYLDDEIRQKADSMAQNRANKLELKYQGLVSGTALYGILVTVLTAIHSEAFKMDFKAFFVGIWKFLSTAFMKLLEATRKPFGGMEREVLQKALPFVIAVVISVLIFFLLGVAIRKIYDFYTEFDYLGFADEKSLTELLISFAVAVWFAEPIRNLVPINLLLLIIIAHVIFIAIRVYLRKKS